MAFIGIDRAIENHWIYQDNEYFKVWFEILLRARFGKDTEKKLIEGELVTIEYGHFVFGRIKWSERLKVSERRIRTLFEKLLKDGMIELVSKYRKCTVYKVVNYAKYHVKNDQQSDQQQDQPQQGFTGYIDQQSDQPVTSERPADDQRATTQEQSKQRNKVNKVNKVKDVKLPFAENVKLTEPEYQRLVSEFGKELTDSSVEFLSSYKIEKDYKTKDDNLTIRRWVIKRVKEDTEKVKGFKSTNKQQPNLQLLQMTDEQRKEYRNDVNKILERNGVSPAVNI